jgi:hypothetical protein
MKSPHMTVCICSGASPYRAMACAIRGTQSVAGSDPSRAVTTFKIAGDAMHQGFPLEEQRRFGSPVEIPRYNGDFAV